MALPSVFDFIQIVESVRGARYVLGAEANYSDAHPKVFDCSELTSWGAARAGSYLPDGARNQWSYCVSRGSTINLSIAYGTFGALLFRVSNYSGDHVAVSLGDGRTFEARGRAYGTNYFTAANRRWTGAALVPGMDYSSRQVPRVMRMFDERDRQTHDALGRVNTMLDRFMKHYGLNPVTQPSGNVPDPLDQTHNAAARIESDLPKILEKFGVK